MKFIDKVHRFIARIIDTVSGGHLEKVTSVYYNIYNIIIIIIYIYLILL